MNKARHPYGARLTMRRKRHAVKLWVPKELHGRYLGPGNKPVTSVVRILRGGTRDEIRRQADTAIAEIQAEFNAARGNLSVGTIPDAIVRQVAEQEGRRAYDQLAARFLLDRAEMPKIAETLLLHDVLGELAYDRENPLLAGASTNGYASVQLRRLGYEPTADSIDKLATAILTAQRSAIDAIQTGVVLPPMPAGRVRAVTPIATGTAPPVSEIAAQYLDDHKVAWTEKKTRNTRNALRLLQDHTDDAHFDTIGRAAVAAWVKKMIASGLRNATVKHYVSTVSSAFTWCQETGVAGINDDSINPFRTRRLSAEDNKWLPFTIDELRNLFAGVSFDPECERDWKPCLPWAMAVALYSGMREEEITVAEVRKIGQRHYFYVPDGKTTNATRNIPVHSVLLRLGVVDFYKGGWPEKMAETIAKRFPEYRRTHGAPDRPGAGRDNRIVFHSFRKCFTESIEGIVQEGVIKALVGHARGFTLDTYSPRGPNFKVLADAIGKVKFPGIKLS